MYLDFEIPLDTKSSTWRNTMLMGTVSIFRAAQLETGKMLARESSVLTPETSAQSSDCHIGYDSSFFKFGSFCKGARKAL